MTQATQLLPPYLSASTFTISTGGAVSTGVTLVEIPITYFGPSIPLGTNGVWTFGGSTSPPSLTSSTAIPSSTSSPTTPILSSSLPSSSLSQASSQLSSSLSQVSSQPLSSTTSFSSSSQSPVPSSQSISNNHLNLRRVLPGIIIGGIAGVLLILLLIFLLCRYRRRRRNLQYNQANFSDYLVVETGGQTRLAGEGVPRPTGGEEDPFLSTGSDVLGGVAEPGATARLVTGPQTVDRNGDSAPAIGQALGAEQGTATLPPRSNSKERNSNPFFGASGTSIFYNPKHGPDPDVVVQPDTPLLRDSSSTGASSGPPVIRGPIMPPHQLLKLDDEWQKEEAAAEAAAQANIASQAGTSEMGERTYGPGDSPLRPPPILNPDGLPLSPRHISRRNSVTTQHSTPYSESPASEADEATTFLTARRVLMNEAGPSTLLSADSAWPPSNWSTNIAFGNLTRLPRLSWFQRLDNTRSSASSPERTRPGTPQGRSSTDREISAGRAAARNLGLNAAGERPISHTSGQSILSSTGNTVFHDAVSTVSTRPGTPGVPVPPMSPPRAVTATPPPNDSSAHFVSTPYMTEVASGRPHSNGSEEGNPSGVTIDVLDMPAPPPVSPFSTSSSRSGPALPPGLEHLMTPRSWRESSSDMPSAASFGTGSTGTGPVLRGGVDVLEEAPPSAGAGWASLRTTTVGIDPGRRTTLGQPILIDQGESRHSEQASLHSIPSHLSRLSPLASGANSRAPSRHTQYNSSSYSSGSSRGRSAGSGISASLTHSNSISSDGRRRPRREAGEPTPPPTGYGRASLTAMGRLSPFASPQRSPAYNSTFTSQMTGGTSTTASDVSGSSHITHSTIVDAQTDPVAHFPITHWGGTRDIV